MEEKSKNKALLSDQNAKVSESKAKTKIPDTSKIYLDQVASHAYYIITHIIHIIFKLEYFYYTKCMKNGLFC